MAKKDKDGNWLDEKGRAIPESYIKPEDIARLIAFRNNPSDESWIGEAK